MLDVDGFESFVEALKYIGVLTLANGTLGLFLYVFG
jgi:hypothetical protein